MPAARFANSLSADDANKPIAPMNYRTQVLSGIHDVAPAAWDALLARQRHPTPFQRHAFLAALEDAGCVGPATGWTPHHVLLWQGDTLAGAAPLYLKDHSYGEYVFDWAWADAYARHDLAYYPKLLCAIPFTPVTGSRLLASDDAARRALAAALLDVARRADISSLHALFGDDDDQAAFGMQGMMGRRGVQFHWHNPGYRDFDAFLATLSQKRRKNIRAERRKVHEAGVTFRRVRGDEASEADWQCFIRCYRQTYREHHSTPYLNLACFEQWARTMGDALVLIVAQRAGRPIASALLVRQHDAGGGTVYGRYWGALEAIDCLHFETAYYQPQEFCIDEGIALFEGGAQGEHKLWRGFLPVVTHSSHWLAHPAFADAVDQFLRREYGSIAHYVDELREHSPFKVTSAPGERA